MALNALNTGVDKINNALTINNPLSINKKPTPIYSTIDDINNQLTQKEENTPPIDPGAISSVDQIPSDEKTVKGTVELPDVQNVMKQVETYSYGEGSNQPMHAPNGGTPSQFNRFSILTYSGALEANHFKDTQVKNAVRTSHNAELPTLESLLSDFDPAKIENTSKPLYASDFLFDKHYKKIALNRLVIVRRFLYPTYDNLTFKKNITKDLAPIAQAVTYFGEPTENKLKDLLKIYGNIKWEDLVADVHDVDGNEQGFENSPFVGKTGSVGGLISNKWSGGGDPSGRKQQETQFQRSFYGADNYFQNTNKILGPVNVINKTKTRGRGLEGGIESMTINFNYELRSYNSINPRLALIDLICNLLALSYNHAKFWGGMNRYFPNHPQFEFFGGKSAQDDFYAGRYGDYFDGIFKTMGDGFGKMFDVIKGMLSGILKGDFSSAINIIGSGVANVMDLKAAKSRPKIIGFKALLTGLPVGEWHVTIGNPYRPIGMVGNMICEGFGLEFGDDLGFDDFPTNFKYNIKLAQGRPRDSSDIQSLMNQGNGRIYLPPKGIVDWTNLSAATTNSPSTSKSNTNNLAAAQNKAKSTGTGSQASDLSIDNMFAKKMIGTNY